MALSALLLVAGGVATAGRTPKDPVSATDIGRMSASASAADAREKAAQPPVAVFLGDSYTFSDGAPSLGYAAKTASQMGWRAVILGQIGTGYVNSGAASTTPGQTNAVFAHRLPDVVTAHPAIVIVQGSTNDVGRYSVGTVRQAAEAVYASLKRSLPGIPIVAVGPVAVPVLPVAQVAETRDEVAAAAKAAGLPFIDPVAERWLPDANLFRTDHLHPTAAGYTQYALDLVRDLRVIPSLPKRTQ